MYFAILSTAVVLRILSNSFANVFQKKLTHNQINPLAVNAFTYFVLGIICLLAWIFISSKSLSLHFITVAMLVGVLGALGNGFLIKSLEKGELSVLAPINAYKSVVAMLFAMVFLGEMPTIIALGGMALIILGSYFVLDTLDEKFSLELFKNKQIQYRFLALFFTAIEAVFIKEMVVSSSVFTAFVFWAFFGAVFSFVFFRVYNLKLKEQFKQLNYRNTSYLFAIVVCVFVMQFTTNFVFSKMNVSYAIALFQLSAVVSVFLGAGLFREKSILKKLLGTLIMVVGAVLIIVYN